MHEFTSFTKAGFDISLLFLSLHILMFISLRFVIPSPRSYFTFCSAFSHSLPALPFISSLKHARSASFEFGAGDGRDECRAGSVWGG